jgi:hypothetical protein
MVRLVTSGQAMKTISCQMKLRDAIKQQNVQVPFHVFPYWAKQEFSFEIAAENVECIKTALTALGISTISNQDKVVLHIRGFPRTLQIETAQKILTDVFPSIFDLYVFPNREDPTRCGGTAKVTLKSKHWKSETLTQLREGMEQNKQSTIDHNILACLPPLRVSFFIPREKYVHRQTGPSANLQKPHRQARTPANQVMQQRPHLASPMSKTYAQSTKQSPNPTKRDLKAVLVEVQNLTKQMKKQNTEVKTSIKILADAMVEVQKETMKVRENQKQIMNALKEIMMRMNGEEHFLDKRSRSPEHPNQMEDLMKNIVKDQKRMNQTTPQIVQKIQLVMEDENKIMENLEENNGKEQLMENQQMEMIDGEQNPQTTPHIVKVPPQEMENGSENGNGEKEKKSKPKKTQQETPAWHKAVGREKRKQMIPETAEKQTKRKRSLSHQNQHKCRRQQSTPYPRNKHFSVEKLEKKTEQ